MVNVDKSVYGARRNVSKINWTNRRTHTEVIVHTCGSCRISTSSLQNIVFINTFVLYMFNLNKFCDFQQISKFKFFQQTRHCFAYQWLDNLKINKYAILSKYTMRFKCYEHFH